VAAEKVTSPQEIATVAGRLEIADKEELPSGSYAHRVLLKGKVIAELVGNNSVFFEDAYPDDKNARLVLLALGTGGSSCPNYFQILEIKPNGSTLLTDKFGTCSEEYEANYRDGVWEISIPPFVDNPRKWERWQYCSGKLTKD